MFTNGLECCPVLKPWHVWIQNAEGTHVQSGSGHVQSLSGWRKPGAQTVCVHTWNGCLWLQKWVSGTWVTTCLLSALVHAQIKQGGKRGCREYRQVCKVYEVRVDPNRRNKNIFWSTFVNQDAKEVERAHSLS